ncbi:MAG: hypothetical protein CME62_04355 [Halobacteriovoraceae bacterium]|nr:hypothetical protein [Halobacteriovoraceae bacterium]|tara:strand:- start:14271 stop:14921 length:651 start_codon:yes stop_codon:yes gene_type:complete
MRDYPLDFNQLFNFSLSCPYESHLKDDPLLTQLNTLKVKLNFPAVTDDVGSLLGFLVQLIKPEVIFEMGSGYGHSAYWYREASPFIKNIYLTEKRDDLKEHFEHLPWPEDFYKKLDYFQGDAFEKLKEVASLDFLLIDGVKADYLEFLKQALPKMNKGSLAFIDNSYWRGSFLDSSVKKQSAIKIKELHSFLQNESTVKAIFLPFTDGVTLITKLS